jgi:hypothetical protein
MRAVLTSFSRVIINILRKDVCVCSAGSFCGRTHRWPLGILVRVRVFLVGMVLAWFGLASPGWAAVNSPPEAPWQLTVLPEAEWDRPVLRRVPFSSLAVAAGGNVAIPVSLRLAGLSGVVSANIVLTNRLSAGGGSVLRQGSNVLSGDVRGMVDFSEIVAVPPGARAGWYEVWISLRDQAGLLDTIPSAGVTQVAPGTFAVGEVLIEHVLQRRGVSIWGFNEPAGSSEFVDIFAQRWPLFLTASTLPVSGVASPFGRALRFPSTTLSPPSVIIPWQSTPAPPFTLGFWFNLEKGANLTTILGSGVYARNGLKMGLVTRGSNKLAAAWANQSGGTLELISTNRVKTNEWHHLALTFDGSVGVLYVDGVAAARQTGAVVVPATRPLMFQGGAITNETTFSGLVDELLVASSALSGTEISELVSNYRSSGSLLPSSLGAAPSLLPIPDQRVRAGRLLSLRIPVFDGDYDLGPISSPDLPAGALIDSAKRTFHWTPAFTQTGLHLVTIRATDLAGRASESLFAIDVLPAPVPATTNLFLYSVRSTNYPSQQPQLTLITSANLDGLLKEGDRLVLEHATNPAARLRIVSSRGEEMYHGGYGLMPPLPTGHYFVETEGDRRHLMVLPRDYQGSSFLGVMADRPGSPEPLARAAILRPGWRRLGTAVSWADIEPTKGTYNWNGYDQWIAVNRTNGSKLLIMLVDALPVWLRGATEATVITELKRYARDYVRRNKTKFDVLEPFNEPSMSPIKLGSIRGLTNDYLLGAQFLARAYAEVAAVVRAEMGTNVQLAGPTWENIVMPFDRMQAVMGAAGFGGSVTAGDFHDYVMGRRAPDGKDPGFYNVRQSSEIMRRNSGGAPFFVSEIGLHGKSALGYLSDPVAVANEPYGETGIGWYLGFRRTLVSMIMYHGAGATAVSAHDFNIGAALEMGGLEQAPGGKTRGFKPQATAHVMISYWLNQSVPVVQGSKEDRLFVYSIQRPGGESLVFAWTPESTTMPMDPVRTDSLIQSGAVKVHDVFGRGFVPSSFGEEPILFRSSTLSPTALAGAVLGLETASCDEVIDRPAEECDCNNLDNQTCGSLGYGTGTLGCVSNRFDFAGCQFSHPQTMLTAHFPLNELSGTAIQDLSSRQAVARLYTPNISKSWVNSSRGRVLHLDGFVTNVPVEFLVISNRSYQVLPGSGSPFTISMWVNVRSRLSTNWVSIMGCDRYDISGFRMCVLNTGQVGWWTTQGQGNIDLISPSVLSTNAWHHLAVTYHTGGAKLYVDGTVAAETVNNVYLPSGTDIFVGHGMTGSNIYPLNGEVDDIRFYSRVLSALEIARLAAGP